MTGNPPAQVAEGLHAWSAFETSSFDQPIDHHAEGTIIELVGAQDECLDLVEDAATIEPVLKTLPERQRLVLHMRFAQDVTQPEITEHLGVSQMHVSRLLHGSLEALRAGVCEQPHEAG